ncbi:uncharacterized protein V1510DRAFT_408310 [Dipodascopsis tothii]|uniref:uncharacterized protein n=1 Tax=Dipodascopsis tothii TaxID=44089 RepID=UPI0034CF61FE
MSSLPPIEAPAKKTRARKRQTKAAAEDPDVSETSGAPDEAAGGSETGESKNSYIELVQKRIRNLQKRKQKLDKYEQQAASPEAERLNADQLAALKAKDQVDYPLKELDELAKAFRGFEAEEKKAAAAAARAAAATAKTTAADADRRVAAARLEGFQEGIDRVRILVKFLHVASWKRQNGGSTDPVVLAENAAFETLLGLVYMGDETSVEAVEKLATGSDEAVDPSAAIATPFTRIQQQSLSLDDLYKSYAAADEDEPEPEAEPEPAPEAEPAAVEDAIAETVRVPSGGISFLNESEIAAEPAPAAAEPAPEPASEPAAAPEPADEPAPEPAAAPVEPSQQENAPEKFAKDAPKKRPFKKAAPLAEQANGTDAAKDGKPRFNRNRPSPAAAKDGPAAADGKRGPRPFYRNRPGKPTDKPAADAAATNGAPRRPRSRGNPNQTASAQPKPVAA